MPVNHSPEFLLLRLMLHARRNVGEKWDEIARSFGSKRITRAHIHKMVMKWWEPEDVELRIILGLPAYKPMPVCPLHGVVHDYDCTTQVVKPLPKPRKPRPPRNYPGKQFVF